MKQKWPNKDNPNLYLAFRVALRYLGTMSEELAVLKKIAVKLDKAGVPYMISGSVAMNFHAQPRMTRDIDIVIVLDHGNIQNFIDTFKEEFYLDEKTIREEVKRSGMFNLIHNESIIKIDFIIRKNNEFSRSAFERRLEVNLDGINIHISSAEDLILAKLSWAKDSMSEMQLRDVANIKNLAKDIDHSYIDGWLEKLGLREIYKKAV